MRRGEKSWKTGSVEFREKMKVEKIRKNGGLELTGIPFKKTSNVRFFKQLYTWVAFQLGSLFSRKVQRRHLSRYGSVKKSLAPLIGFDRTNDSTRAVYK